MDEQRDRIRWILQRIHQDIINETIPQTDFVDCYMKLAESQKHETHAFVSLSLEFHRGGCWNEEGVVENEFLEWLEEENPVIYLGEVNGKHSEVIENFDTILGDTNDDHYKVEANGHKFPDCLCEVYDEWKEEKKTMI